MNTLERIESKFLDPLRTEQLDVERFRLLSEFRYDSRLLRGRLIVPEGFVTDLDSIPRWLPLAYAILKGEARGPAVIHDFLYQTHISASQQMADRVLKEAMATSGPGIPVVDAWRRVAIYSGLRVGGFIAWRRGPARYLRLGNNYGR